MESRNYAFNQNLKCEYFPCHDGIDKEDFNCLFCFCPLYTLGDKCGGRFSYDNDSNIKDCSNCKLPHIKGSYDYIISKYQELSDLANQNREKED